MRLSPHFTLAELCRSQTAARHGIDNTPNADQVASLKLLAREVLEPVRNHYRIPFTPSSGFRCLVLNRLIKSKDTSQHTKGEAVDFEIPGIDNLAIAEWIRDNLIFDQLILEFYTPEDPASGWVHCSYHQESNRQQSLIFDGKTYSTF